MPEVERLKVTLEADNRSFKRGMADSSRTAAQHSEKIRKEAESVKSSINPIIGEIRKISSSIKQSAGASAIEKMKKGLRDWQIKVGLKVKTADYKEVESELTRMQKKLSGLKLAGRIMENRGDNQKESNAYNKLSDDIKEAEKSLQGLIATQERLKASGDHEEMNPRYLELGKQADEQQTRLDSLNEKLAHSQKLVRLGQVNNDSGLLANEKNVKAYEAEIEKLEKELERTYSEMEKMEDSGKMTVPTAEAKSLAEQIEAARNRIGELKSEMVSLKAAGKDQGTDEWIRNQEAIRDCTVELRSLEQEKQKMEASGSDVTSGSFRHWGNAAKEAAGNIRKSFDSALKVIRRVSGAFASLINRFRNGISAVKSFTGSVAKSIAGIRGLGSTSGGTSINIGNLAKSLLRYGIGIRSLFVLFNKIRGAIVDGFENLAQADNEVNQSISMLMSSLTELKNSLAAAFTPVLETIAPILNGLIRMLITAANAVGQFFGALTGKEYYIQAKAVNEDYAASLQNAAQGTDSLGNNADNANESVKDLKRTLAGFDEITKLDDVTDDSGSGKTDKNGKTGKTPKYGISPGDMFERVNIDSGIKDFAQMIKDAFMNKDWEGIGRMIADLLWKGVKKLGDLFDPSFINPKIDEFTTAVAGIINGFFDPNNELWHGLGGALANILNAAVRTANELWDKVNFENIGKSLGIAFNDLIQRTDTYEMGRLVMQKFNAAIDLATGFLEQNQGNFSSWGQKFEDFLMGALDEIKPAKIARVINLAVSGAIDFLGGIGWTKLGNKIGDKLGELIEKVDTDNIGRLIAKVITSGIDLAKGFLESMKDKWSTLGTKVGGMLATALNNINMGDIEQVISGTMTAVLDFLGSAVEKFKSENGFEKVGEAIAAGLNGVLGNPENWNKLGDLMHDLLIGALQILQKIRENFQWADVANAIHDSIAKVIDDDELWDDAFNELSLWVEDICDFIKDALPTESEWEKIGARIAQFLETVPWGKLFVTVIEAIKNAVVGLWKGLGKTFAGHIVQGIIAFKLSYGLLSPFFSGIGDIIKGELVNRLIGGRIKTMLGSGLTKGATDAAGIVSGNVGLGLFSSAIGSTLLAAGGIIVGGAVFLDACKLFAQGIDALGGGNGQISETGSAWHDFVSQLSESKAITSDQKTELDKLIESMESSNATTEEMGTAVTQALSDAGVSASEYRSAMESTATQISTTSGQFNEMNRNLGKFGEGVSQTRDTIDMSVPGMSEAFGGIRDVLFDMYNEGVPGVADGFSNLDYVLNQVQSGSAPDAQSALDAIVMTLGQDSDAAQIFMDKMKEKFPEAVQTGAKASSTAMDGARTSISGSMTGIEKQISTSSEAARRSLEQKFGEAKAISVKDFADTATGANREFGNVASAAQTKATEARDKWLAGMRSAKTEGEREVTSIRDTAQTRFSDIARAANDNGIKAKLDFVRNLTSAKTESDRELSTTATNAMRHLGAIASTASTKSSEAEKAISSKFGSASTTVNDKTGAMNTDTYRNMQLQFGQVKFFTDNMESYISNKWKIINRDMSNTTMPNFKEAVGTGMNKALTAISGFVDRMADKVGELSGKFKTAGSDAGGELRRGLNEADYSSLGSDIVSAITSPFNGLNTEMWYAGYNAISNLQNGMNTAGLKVPHVGWTWDTVYYGDGDWVQVPNFNVQWYAKGGLFEVPTIAGFGEAGDEAALPLTNRSVMARVANAIVDAGGIGNSLNRDDMVEAVATGVAMAMAQNPQTVEVIVQSVLKTDDERLAQAVSRGQARLDQRYNATPAYGF